MKQFLIRILFLVLLCVAASGSAHAQGDGPDNTLLVQAGQNVAGDLVATSQSIVVDGNVAGDVTTWSGDIRINGHVGGDVVSYSGTIALGSQAHVDGHVLTVSGTIAQEAIPNQVNGQMIAGAPGGRAVFGLIDLVTPSVGGTEDLGPFGRFAFGFAAVLILAALSTFGTMLWPRRTLVTSSVLRAVPWRSAAIGLLTSALLGVLLLPIGALLAITLVGVPLLLPLLLLLQLPYVYGLATVGQTLGRRLLARQRELGTLVGVLVILLPLAILSFVLPFVSFMILYTIASIGLGAAIISRAGTLWPGWR